MNQEKWQTLGPYLTLRLSELDETKFEHFITDFLNSGLSLSINRYGKTIRRGLSSASLYGSRGQKQFGIDVLPEVEGDGIKEKWVFQCKRHKTWTEGQTQKAIQKARDEYPTANHYFLVISVTASPKVREAIAQHAHADWTLWDVEDICRIVKFEVPHTKLLPVLQVFEFNQETLKRFAGFATDRFVDVDVFFGRMKGEGKVFRHDRPLVGREKDLEALFTFVNSSEKRVMALSAIGGTGKSRLLMELAERGAERFKKYEWLFLNPYSQDRIDFSFLDKDKPRVIIVDDAHRLEQIPSELFSLLQQLLKTKVIFSMCLQGKNALEGRIVDAGFKSCMEEWMVTPLKKEDTKKLIRSILPRATREELYQF